eukprot:Platyproteum_vivax@DN4139_c0_g1_i1.p1
MDAVTANNNIEEKETKLNESAECVPYLKEAIEKIVEEMNVEDDTTVPHHVYMMHGLWGQEYDFLNIASRMQHKYPKVQIFTPSVNTFKCYDGVEVCGQRLADYIMETLPKKEGRLSFIGHSFGGLVLRASLHLARAAIGHHELVNLVTFATPHLGIPESLPPLRIGALVLQGKTFSDLTLQNDSLKQLCSDEHIDLLKQFQSLVVYGNLITDPLVGERTALIADALPAVHAECKKQPPRRGNRYPLHRKRVRSLIRPHFANDSAHFFSLFLIVTIRIVM